MWATEKVCERFKKFVGDREKLSGFSHRKRRFFCRDAPSLVRRLLGRVPTTDFCVIWLKNRGFSAPQKIAKMHAKTVRVVRKICTRAKFFQQKSQMRPEIGQKIGRDVPFLSPTSPVFQPGIAPYCKICVDKTQLLNHPRELGRLFRVSTRCWSVISKVPYHRELPAGFPPKLRRRFTD